MIKKIVFAPSDINFDLLDLSPIKVLEPADILNLPDEEVVLVTCDSKIIVDLMHDLTKWGITCIYPEGVVSDDFDPTSNLRGIRNFKSLPFPKVLEVLRVDPVQIESLIGTDGSEEREETEQVGLEDIGDDD
jgi:hypothetical protein